MFLYVTLSRAFRCTRSSRFKFKDPYIKLYLQYSSLSTTDISLRDLILHHSNSLVCCRKLQMGSIEDLTEETLSLGSSNENFNNSMEIRLSQESCVSMGSDTLTGDDLSVTCSQHSTGELSLLNLTASDCSLADDLFLHDATLLDASYDADCSEAEEGIEGETWSDRDTPPPEDDILESVMEEDEEFIMETTFNESSKI